MRTKSTLRLPIFISVIFTSVMVFYSMMPAIVTMVICAVYAIYLYISIRRFYRSTETMYLCAIFLVPTSTISVLGTSYSNFPLSWFHLYVILLFFVIAISQNIKFTYFVLTITFFLYTSCVALLSGNVFDAMKQVLTISLFLVSFTIGYSLAKRNSLELVQTASKCYIYTTLAFAIQVFLQRAFIRSIRSIIGHYATFGGGREAYAGLMGDYSFATLYLATGSIMVLIEFMDWNRISIFQFLSEEIILLSAIIAVTARTGIVALGIIIFIYFLKHTKHMSWKMILLLFVVIIAVPIVLHAYTISRGNQDLLDSSGRFENYFLALEYFGTQPIFGVGLGLNNLKSRFYIGVPHNFFVQYLLQIGLVGISLLILFYGEFLQRDFNKNNEMKWVFWLIVIGSMFIPDIFSSRFYNVIIILCMLERRQVNYVQKKS